MDILVFIAAGFVIILLFLLYLASGHSHTMNSLKIVKEKLGSHRERVAEIENKIKTMESRLKILEFRTEILDDHAPPMKPGFHDEVTTPTQENRSVLQQWEIERLEGEITSIKELLNKML